MVSDRLMSGQGSEATIMSDKRASQFSPGYSGILLTLLILCLLAACVPAELEPAFGGPVPVTRDGTATPFPLPTETATPTNDDWFLTLTTTPMSEALSGPTPTQTPAPLFPGMIYMQEGSLWRVTGDWQPQLVAEQAPGANLSPDGQLALFQEGDDLWLIDLVTGQEHNLTQDSGRRHCCSQWWPGQPGRIIFGSWPDDSDLGPSTGFLSAMNVDGSDYTVLDEEVQSNGSPAPGPDGQTIAYDRAGTAWLYRPETGATSLDPSAFGLNNVVRIGGPAWSPDGQRIAWSVAVQDPDWRIALAIFDLETSSAWLLHPYQNIGRGGWFPPPAWSPDGRWLAFVAEDMEPEKRGVWVVAAGGDDEHYLGPGAKPLWSPDGRWLTYTAYPDPVSGLDPSALLVEAGSWYTIHLSLPPGAEIIHWLE